MIKSVSVLLVLIFTMKHTYAEVEAGPKKEILISAAASLKEVFTELGADFKKQNNVNISFNFSSSGQLRIQIENGAPVDIFAAASLGDMDTLENKKLLLENTKINFAKNTLVLIQNINSKTQIKNIDELKKKEVKKIAIGSPESVPAGWYAKESLVNLKYFDVLKEKLVFGESVRQVLDYTCNNEVDAGVVYSTDALINKNIRKVLEIPESTHKTIVYPIAVIKTSQNEKIAKEFIKFITSKSSKEVFKKYGFK